MVVLKRFGTLLVTNKKERAALVVMIVLMSKGLKKGSPL